MGIVFSNVNMKVGTKMTYYLIRILFLGILVALSITIFKKSKKLPVFSSKIIRTPDGDYVKRIFSKQIKIDVVIVLLLFLISFYPFEGSFIRFSSTMDSLKYSTYDYNLCEFEIIEDKKCDFIFSDNNYYSVSKYDDGFSLTNYNCSIKSYYSEPYDIPYYSCYVENVYNEFADKSCLFVTIEHLSQDEILQVTYNNMTLTDYYSPYPMSRKYCFAINGKIDSKSINIQINDHNIKLSKLF